MKVFHGKSLLSALLSLSLIACTAVSTLNSFAANDSTTSESGEYVLVDSEQKTGLSFEQVNETRTVTLSSKANAVLTGGTTGAPTGTSIYMTLSTEGKSGILKAFGEDGLDITPISNGEQYILDAWVWVSDVSKANPFVIRLFDKAPVADGNQDKIGGQIYQWNSGMDLDSLTSSADGAKLANGWNHITAPITGVTATALKYIAIYNHGGAGGYDAAVASVSLKKVASEQNDYTFISGNETATELTQVNPAADASVAISSVQSGTLTGGETGAPTIGNAVSLTIPKGKQAGIRKTIDVNTGASKTLSAWIWVEDASLANMILCMRLYSGEPVAHANGGYVGGEIANGNRALNNDINTLVSGTQKLQTGWNHIVLDARNIQNKQLKYIVIYNHTTGTTEDVKIAVASVTLEFANSGSDMDLITSDDSIILTQTNKNAPASVAVKNNSELIAGAEKAPAGNAYYATIDNTARAGIAVENLNVDVSNFVDKNRKSGDLYQFDAWVWIEDATKVGNFVFRFYANNLPVNPTNGSWIEGWVWQFNGMEDIDSTKEGKQTLQTGWNHVIKDVQEMGANIPAFVINAVSIHDHRNFNNQEDSYSFAFASAKFVKVGELEESGSEIVYEKVDSGLNYNCDVIDNAKYDYGFSEGDDTSQALQVDTADKKEGAGSLSYTYDKVTSGKLLLHINTPLNTPSDSVPSYQIEDYDNRYFAFWFYCDNPLAVNRLALELSSDSSDTDKDEWEWNLTAQIKNKGWNYIIAPLGKSTAAIGKFDKENIRRWRIFCLGNESQTPVNVKIDDISVVKVELDMEQTPEKGLNDSCDVINKDKYTYDASVALDTTDVKEGSASLKFTNPNTAQGTIMKYVANKGKLNFAINSIYTNYISFKIYVNDISLVQQAAIELSSLGQDASDELQVDFLDQLTLNGWNEVHIPLLAYESKMQNIDLEHIRHFRIFMLGNGNGQETIIKLDDVRLGDSAEDGNGNEDLDIDDDVSTPSDIDEPEDTGVRELPLVIAILMFTVAGIGIAVCMKKVKQ